MSAIVDSTPAADGYRMPAEWEPHTGCWMVWPERTDVWRLGARPAQQAFAAVAAAVATAEPVTVAVSARQLDHARALLPHPDAHGHGVRVVEMTTDDAWARDSGPTFVVDEAGGVRGVDWQFNAWGGLVDGLYFPWAADDAVARKVCEVERVDRYRADFVLEGGSVDVDGEGTVLTTEECLLSAGRNPHLTKEQIEQRLCDHLGATTVVWLPWGTYDDETNGHVDNMCRFTRPGQVMLTWTDDPSDPQHARSVAAEQVLRTVRDAQGRPLDVVRVHQPGPLTFTPAEAAEIDQVPTSLPRRAGDRLAGSYVNFYLGNGVVVLPVFDDPHDEAAVAACAAAFPDRRVLTVPGREILLGGGNAHCITQQVPAARR